MVSRLLLYRLPPSVSKLQCYYSTSSLLSQKQPSDDETFRKNVAEAKAKLAAKRAEKQKLDSDARFKRSNSEEVFVPPETRNPYLAPVESELRLKNTTDFNHPPGRVPVLHNYKGEVLKNEGKGHLEVSQVEGVNYPFLADKSPYSGLKAKRYDKKLLAQHKTLSDPIWHLTGGRHAIDAPSLDTARDFNDDRRIWKQWVTGPVLFFIFVKLVWQQFYRPDEEGIYGTTVSEGCFHFTLEDELVNLREKDKPLQVASGYGAEILRSTTYRQILKSECLKKYGLEKGRKIYEDTIYEATGSYDLAHVPEVIPSSSYYRRFVRFIYGTDGESAHAYRPHVEDRKAKEALAQSSEASS